MDDVTAWFEEEFGKGVDPLALTEDQIAANPDTFLYSVLYNNYVLYDYHYCYKAPEIRHAVAKGIYETLKKPTTNWLPKVSTTKKLTTS